MAIRVALHHATTYHFDRPVSLGPHVVRLRPAPHCRTPVVSYALHVKPKDHFLNWQQDPHGNFLARLVFPKPSRELTIEVDLIAELTVINPFDFFLEPSATEYPFTYETWLESELAPYLRTIPAGPQLQQLIKQVPLDTVRTVDFLVAINQLVHNRVKYVIRMEPGVQSPEETLELSSGSCRDSAWLLVQLLRHMGLAARFVSGYLIQLKPDVESLDGPSGASHDFTDLHAWTEVYLPGAGWVGLDPTSGLFAAEGHLPLAATPDPTSAAPVAGAVDPCEVKFDFAMTVQRIHEDPRVTKPYTDEQWEQIDSLGQAVDERLSNHDARLTMGGEPTFVSIDDMDGAEWNTAAMGPHKRERAGDLFRRLAAQFASSPLLHFGQGKWYPGESLPRWALTCYWRADGQPVWHDPRWIAEDDAAYGHTEQDAQRFVKRLAENLLVGPQHAVPGFEDAWYYMWKERRLPVNVDPLESNLRDREERERLSRVFEQGLNKVVGYCLPLRPKAGWVGRPEWESGPWFFRPERMFLIPGDSPMGLRLPLDSIPWVSEHEYPHIYEMDPLAARGELPNYDRRQRQSVQGRLHSMTNTRDAVAARERHLVHQIAGLAVDPELRSPYANPWADEAEGLQGKGGFGGETPIGDGRSSANGDGRLGANGAGRRGAESGREFDGQDAADYYRNGRHLAPPRLGESAAHIVRTAVCVQAREGLVHVFMPPVGQLEEYLDLVSAVEQTAVDLQMPVRVEGYPPPYDPRLRNFKVTPDPGVIEVNTQPASSWTELSHNTNVLYEQARLARLGAEKFMLDGRHTGTGGGNHVVMGGATPAESPFLRRPDLLRSLVAYWNNRPSLSYLFSGLFIGPTSQAPRVDEARHESIYELETAFHQLPQDRPAPPWLVDRLFRHLLIDVTGNTHRSEFCIDKLYSPDSSTGRLGLVEFRGFEMPPHARMSLTQQLLIRALIARFWEQPYTQRPVRWGTALHDRFLLPHFIAQDFAEVIGEMNDAGFPFEQDWFAPHFEFRFPLIGQVAYQGVQMELRQAIEPWHVLGEEPGGGGTVRFVDSSLERVQIKVRGLTNPRYVISCNGRRVPLHPTGAPGEFVAGVRFRAWQPASCLHPTIGVHTPLVFDMIDRWNQRAIGGCTWHVAHPGGRSFERFPVNAYEAESRRIARFIAAGHTAGDELPMPPPEHNPDYPLTLDMRRPIELATLNE
ncbi:MAG: transglutaminase family protein [Pirellulales bacterium]